MEKIDLKKDNYLFLIGNGINMAMGNSDCQWEDVLYKITPDELKGELFVEKTSSPQKFIPLLSLTETINAIQLHYSSAENHEVAKDLAKNIDDFKFKKRKSTLLSFIKINGIDVLTTNFDMNIEHWLCEDKNQVCKIETGKYYYWDKSFSVPGSDAKVWHVHGSIDKYRSILFSMTRYMRAAGHATTIMNDKSNDYAALKKTWIWQFLSRPLVIVGWRCAKEEAFLRWLLIERLMSCRRFGIGELPPSYYLYIEKSDIRENKDFLKFVKIKPVCLGDDVFDHGIWNQTSAVIELPEVK